jgi:predicted phosphodiesterase
MNTLNINRIGVAGDWHGNTGHALKALKLLAGNNIATIAHVGDFGVWPGNSGAIRKS